MNFTIVSAIENIELIAVGNSIRELERLQKMYGIGRWRKQKGIARISVNNAIRKAEIHWYEAHGRGRKEFKIKRFLD